MDLLHVFGSGFFDADSSMDRTSGFPMLCVWYWEPICVLSKIQFFCLFYSSFLIFALLVYVRFLKMRFCSWLCRHLMPTDCFNEEDLLRLPPGSSGLHHTQVVFPSLMLDRCLLKFNPETSLKNTFVQNRCYLSLRLLIMWRQKLFYKR